MHLLFYFLTILNCLAFTVTAYDKRLAVKNKRRVSEKTLLSFVVFGGTIGAAFAMLLFRHKTAKKSYVLRFIVILLFQLMLLFYFFSSKL